MLAIDAPRIGAKRSAPSVNLPALVSFASGNNSVQSPTAWKTKGDDYNRNPVGTGPYILKSWSAGDRMVLERNPDYFKDSPKPQPKIDKVEQKTIWMLQIHRKCSC